MKLLQNDYFSPTNSATLSFLIDASADIFKFLKPHPYLLNHTLQTHMFPAGFTISIMLKFSCLHRASIVSKHFFIVPTDAHNYKILGILKTLKFRQLLRSNCRNFNCF